MHKLSEIEAKLDNALVKKAPYQIPESGKKWIVEYSPWINLVFGLLALYSAKSLWNLGHSVNKLVNYLNDLSRVYGGASAQQLGFTYWLALIILVAEAVVMLLAVPGLMKRSKSSGWNLVFYGALFNLAYGLIYAFTGYNNAVSQLFGTLVGSTIGLYVLFQVRSHYK